MNEIVERVKEKYPEYKDVPDDVLTAKLADRYPQYLSNASFSNDVNRVSQKIGGPSAPDIKVLAPVEMTPELAERLRKGTEATQGQAETFEAATEQIQHPTKRFIAPIARTLDVTGKLLAGGTEDAFTSLLTSRSQEEEVAHSGAPEESNITAIARQLSDTGTVAEPLPLESDIALLPPAGRVASKAVYGTVETVPRLAAVAGLQAAGVPAPVGAAAVFGMTEKGFDPKQAAVAAAIPFVGQYGGEISGAIAKQFGVESTTAINFVKGIGGLTAPAAAIVAEGEASISQLPEEQRHEARVNLYASVLGQSLLGPMGVEYEGKPSPAMVADRIKPIAPLTAEALKQTVKEPEVIAPAEKPTEAVSKGEAAIVPEEATETSGATETPPAVQKGDRVPKQKVDSDGFKSDEPVMNFLNNLPIGSQVKRRNGDIFQKNSEGTWDHRPDLLVEGNGTVNQGVLSGGGLEGGEVLRVGRESAAQPELVGMGGATPKEFETSPQTPTGIKNAQVDIERQQRGLPPAVQPARKSFGEVWDSTMAKIDNDPGYQDRLIAELRDKPRALTDAEDAALLHRQIDLQNEYGKATRDLAQAYDDGRMDDVGQEQARVAAISDQLLDLYNVGKKVGTETGRGLNARKMMAYEDFSLANMELEKRAANTGKPLTPTERANVTALHEKIQATQKAYDEYVSKSEDRIRELEVKRALDEVERQAKQEPTYHPSVLKIAENYAKKWDAKGQKALEELKAIWSSDQALSGPINPEVLDRLATYGVSKLVRGVVDLAKWTDSMVGDLGERFREHAQTVFDASQKKLNDDLSHSSKAFGPQAETVKRAIKKQDAKEQGDAIGEAIKRKVSAGKKNEISPQANKLARMFVELGIKDRNELIDAVHAELQKYIADITRRETMDAVSGYGDFKQLTKDEISVQLRDLKGQMQQVGKLEDMQKGQAPAKTGVERRTPSDEERRLIKQVEEAKKKGGYVVTDPATQLRSALQSIKTRLENQIADLEHEISTKTKIVREDNTPPTSPEVEALKARRDELKAQRDELFGDKQLTDEQRVKLAMRAVEASIAEYERRIKAGELKTPKTPSLTPQTPELVAARAKRDALREQLQELRDLDPALQAEKHANALETEKRTLEKTIAEQERRLREGDVAPRGASMNRPADPALESLKQKRDALTNQLAEARKKPAAQKYAEALQRRLDGMNKSIADKEAKIASGDVSRSTVKKQNRPLPPELEMAKQRLELLNKQIADLRKGPPKTPEERALQSLKTRLANQIEQYQEKLANGDFSKKEKRIVQMDAEANRLHFEATKAKIAWHEALMKDRLAKRSLPAKILGTIGEVLNTSRAIITSLDLSAVLRQGGFIALGHPLRALRSFPAMFRALRSEEGQHAVNQEILTRKNYPLYNQSKLYLSEHGQKLSQMEEAYMSRWADKIPLVAGSQRAYVTFLNKLRADSFDAMAASLSRTGELTPNEANAISNFINVSTGRGNLGAKENALVGLNTVFFAPRYVASRFQLLAGQPLYRGTARTRVAVAKEYGRFLVGVGLTYALAKAAGATVEDDPRSSDFGKLKFGNTHVDPLAGLSQVTVLLSRLASGETKNGSGKIVPIRGPKVPYGSGNSADVMARFLRSKLSPAIGTIVNLLTGKDVVGQPVTLKSTAANLLMPLSFQDIYSAMKTQNVPTGVILSLLALFGMGVQTYDSNKSKGK